MAGPNRTPPPTLPEIVAQHAEEAAHLCISRRALVGAPQAGLAELLRHDERIAAHLDGLRVAGEDGSSLAWEATHDGGVGAWFTASVIAVSSGDRAAIERAIDASARSPHAREGLDLALAWVRPSALRGIVNRLLASPLPHRRLCGLAACGHHAVDPGATLDDALTADDPALRTEAWRTAGRSGVYRALAWLPAAFDEANGASAWEAARTALLLGDRGSSIEFLEAATAVACTGEAQRSALRLLLMALPLERARGVLAQMAPDESRTREVIGCIAAAGDVARVPWLLQWMGDDTWTRAAGEALTTMTGVDLVEAGLDRAAPVDDGDEANLSHAEDDGLPWPDANKMARWWHQESSRFPLGRQSFMGQVPSHAALFEVLRRSNQRQRRAAAAHIALRRDRPAPLFDVAAPARRQARALEALVLP